MIPVLRSQRLFLRPFRRSDAPQVAQMAGDYDLYRTTLNLPHPYALSDAQNWIDLHEAHLHEHSFYTWAIEVSETGTLVGCLSIGQNLTQHIAEVGYWIGKEHWNNGYGTEGTMLAIDFAFKALGVNKVIGRYFAVNPASGKIMAKCGMDFEGILKEAIYKDGTFHDLGYYGLLRSQWLALHDHRNHIKLDIKKANVHDASAIQYIEKKAFDEDIIRYGDRTDCPANENMESIRLKIQMHDYYGIYENDKLIGAADVRTNETENTCHLARIFIDPRYQNLGIGKKVMIMLESLYPNAKRWSLDTPFKNLRNHHFYESLGYKHTGTKVIDEVLSLFDYVKINI